MSIRPASPRGRSESELARAGYRACTRLAADHYENFPVASWFLPRRIRPAVAAIYAFARTADDIADEGDASTADRLAQLDRLASELDRIELGESPPEPPWAALADAVWRHGLPVAPFHDLLSAFRDDARGPSFADAGELMDYCRRSANPVGRLLLVLFQADTAVHRGQSDAICTALQLINFLQDLERDCAAGRIYIPRDEMHRFGVSPQALLAGTESRALRALIQHQATRANRLLLAGAPLATALPGRIGFELRLIVLGGSRILHRLSRRESVFARPVLRGNDWAYMMTRALLPRWQGRHRQPGCGNHL